MVLAVLAGLPRELESERDRGGRGDRGGTELERGRQALPTYACVRAMIAGDSKCVVSGWLAVFVGVRAAGGCVGRDGH